MQWTYIDAATTGILSPHVLPVEDLREMLIHIKAELPSTMHLQCYWMTPFTSTDICAPMFLVAEEHFLLLIDIPIRDHGQQLEIYQVFNLLIPKGNLSPCYNIGTRYLEISYGETKAVEISEQQFTSCHKQMDKSAILMQLYNHLPTHPHALPLSIPRTK